MHPLRRHAALRQQRAHRLDHPERPAHIGLIHRAPAQHRPQQPAQLLPLQPPVQHLDVLPLPRQHVQHRQPVQIPILQILQHLPKQHVPARAAAIEKKEPAQPLSLQHRLHHRQHRRDPRPCGEPHMHPRLIRPDRRAEPPDRRHHLQRPSPAAAPPSPTARTRRLPAGGSQSGVPPHPRPSRSNTSAEAPPRPASTRSVRILPGAERVGTPKRLRHGERHRNRIRRLPPHISHHQPMKPWRQ